MKTATEIRTIKIRELVKANGGVTKFAEALNRDQSQISQWISEKNPKGIGEKIAREIEEKLNLQRGYLDKIDEPKDGLVLPKTKFKIYEYEAKASMGNGIEVITPDNIVGYEIFDDRFLSDFRVKKENLAIITVVGDSMEPTLQGGGRVVIDVSVKDKMDNKVFALTTKNSLWVKRLRMTPDGYKWQSDNDAHREFDKSLNETPTTVRIIGMVLYSLGRAVK